MPLIAGTRVGPYEVLEPLGAGGMGEVYRARDVHLGRLVALKILPDAFSGDSDRLARFEREARTLATLNHPHIAQIYGVERRAADSGAPVLVMEYVNGTDLSAVMDRGALPLEEAVSIARQICEALEAAHDQGIVHRDLKPGNIKVRRDETIKVLDFGLAKMAEQSPAAAGDTLADSDTREAPDTATGVLLGTAPYMAPEQASGRPVDKRADIWAFGVIFFELLAGRRLFGGHSATEVLASVLTQQIPWHQLPSATPPHLRTLMARCLERDARRRLRDIGEARVLLEPGYAASLPVPLTTVTRTSRGLIAAVGLVALIAVGVAWALGGSPRREGPLRFTIEVPPSVALTRPGVNPVLTVSPNGGKVAFATGGAIWVWSAETGQVERLADTEGGRAPFFSHDGREIGFFTADELRRIAVSGGPAATIARAAGGGAAAWASDDTILYHRWVGEQIGLWRVKGHGGQPQLLKRAGRQQELRGTPVLLPDGRHFLYITGDLRVSHRQMCVGSIDAEDTTCFPGGDSFLAYSPTGHVLFVRRGQLMALPFDAARRRPSGEPFSLGPSVRWFGPTGAASFALASDGRTLVYQPPAGPSRLTWVDRRTRAATPLTGPARYGSVLLSSDETKVATEIWNDSTEGRDLYTVDVVTGIPSRVTAEEIDAIAGAWARDGQLVFSRAALEPPDIFSLFLERPRDATLRLAEPGVQIARHESPDGRYIAYVDQNAETQERLQVQLLARDGTHRVFRDLAGDSFDPRFSPDGLSLAYAAIDSDGPQIFVARVDGSGVPRRLSPHGGVLPRWRADGRELFYVQGDGMIVAVDPAATLPVPSLLFHIEGIEPNLEDYRGSERWFDYDVSRDGQRFLIRQPVAGGQSRNLRVVIGWLGASQISRD